MPPYRDRRDGTWRWRATVRLPSGESRRLSGTPSLDTRAEAIVCEREGIERALREARDPPAPESPTLTEWLATYFATRGRAHLRPTSLAACRRRAELHILPVLGATRIDRIGSGQVAALGHALVGEGLSARTANGIVAVLSSALRYAAAVGQIGAAPHVEWLPEVEPATRHLSLEEYARLVAATRLAPMPRAAILLAGDAGLRVGEVLGLRWGDVELQTPTPYVRVRRQQLQSGADGPTKSGRERSVPLTAQLAECLRGLPRDRDDDHVIRIVGRRRGRGPGRRSGHVLTTMLGRFCDRADLPRLGFHALRHTFCSSLAARGATEWEIAALAGHASTATTRRYVHMTGRSLVSAIRLLDVTEGPGLASADVLPLDPGRRRKGA